MKAQAVELPPVPKQLTEKIAAPLCELQPRQDYSTEELRAAIDCWRASFGNAVEKHDSLAAAVRVRERATGRLARGN